MSSSTGHVETDDRGLVVERPRPDLPGAPSTIGEVLDAALGTDPEREALVGADARYTYAGLDRAANRAAHAFLDLGVGPGDRVAAALRNECAIVVAFLGAMRVGALWVGINRALAWPEKEFLLADSGASTYLADPEMADEVPDDHATAARSATRVVVVDPTGEASTWADALRSAPIDPVDLVTDPHEPAAIAYTSGTTGRPKGVVHSQHNMLLPGAVARAAGTSVPGSRQGVALPLTILNLMVLGPLVSFQVEGTVVAMDRIDAAGMAGWISRERITTFSAVPTMVYDLLTDPGVSADDLASLDRPGVGGADLPEDLRSLYRERFGAEITTGYGLTEAPTAVTVGEWTTPQEPGSSGRALPHVDIVIVDGNDEPLGPGEVGEVCVRPATDGPFAGAYTPMLGYWRRPDATREALRGGVLHTGDLGELDDTGTLLIRDRKGDLIIRGGANVYPAEVERVLHAESGVAGCAVIGKPDERLGERVVAVVEARAGATVDEDGLRRLCTERLARYKVPEEFVFVDRLPRTPMGKVRKAEVRALLDPSALGGEA